MCLDCVNFLLCLCFSNANLTRGLCVAVTARPTTTIVNYTETPASLGPKSRWIMMDTAKVRQALHLLQGNWSRREPESRSAGQNDPNSFHLDHGQQSCGNYPDRGDGSSCYEPACLGLEKSSDLCPGLPTSDPNGDFQHSL